MTPGRTLLVVDESVVQRISELTAKVDRLLEKAATSHRKDDSNRVEKPEFGFLRVPQILEIIPVGPTTWWKWVKEGFAPKGVKLGRNTRVWKVEEIRALTDKIAAGAMDDAGDS